MKALPLKHAYNIFVHKSQGMIHDRVVIDICLKEFRCGLTYVALSCVITVDSLIISPSFTNNDSLESTTTEHDNTHEQNLQQLLALQ